MTSITDPAVTALLDAPNYAVISTHNADGSILSTVVWIHTDDGGNPVVNTAIGRKWPTNLDRDPRVTVVVPDAENPYSFVEIRGVARSTVDGAEAQIDALAKKYIGQDTYPFRQPGERRITYTIDAEVVRYIKQ
jgi:PPOX class probable F420-dependent enzyme